MLLEIKGGKNEYNYTSSNYNYNWSYNLSNI